MRLETSIGKWNDEENYDLKQPAWRRMLNIASEYEEVRDIQEVLAQLGKRNLYGDIIRIYIIGYVLRQKNVDLTEYISDDMISKIDYFSSQSKGIYDYAELIVKECR